MVNHSLKDHANHETLVNAWVIIICLQCILTLSLTVAVCRWRRLACADGVCMALAVAGFWDRWPTCPSLQRPSAVLRAALSTPTTSAACGSPPTLTPGLPFLDLHASSSALSVFPLTGGGRLPPVSSSQVAALAFYT